MKKRTLSFGVIATIASLLALGWAGFQVWRWIVTPSEGPLVGVSQSIAWHSRLGLSNKTYEAALALAKARVYEFRPGDGSPTAILDAIDGLVVAGGADVDQAMYGGEPSAAIAPKADRDAFESALIRGALARDMPILGVCRGVQILNVLHGGSLRNIRADPIIGPNHGGKIEWEHHHEVTLTPTTLLAKVEQVTTKRVNSYHGQAVGRVGSGLTVSAKSADGVVEALERQDRIFVIGVQWHPEILALDDKNELRILDAFVAAAQRYGERRPVAARR
jgi:gamma-glutamyl-gamma-aminobutyrate hydrolase PuuD